MRRCISALVVFLVFFSSNYSFGSPAEINSQPVKNVTAPDSKPAIRNRLQNGAPIRVLALRVEFIADDVATTTGDGRFDLTDRSTYTLDKPPHNRIFFQQQLLALANYFRRVSNDNVQIESVVYPLEENRAYQLPQNMVYYSGEENEVRQKQRWAELLRDALNATAADSIDFSEYQSYVIFHAGVGQDFAFDIDSTPYDIQSVYIDFETLRETLGAEQPDYKGIPAGDGYFIQDGIILPETQNQEGLELGLLGTITLLMGSQIGMPNLFDTETGRAGVGRWGLMDQGSFNFQGFIPAEPCAWEKVYMGWENPVTISYGQNNVRIGTRQTVSAPHIIKIPISSKEYFLIENRQRDVNGDGITIGRDEFGRRVEFDSTGRVVSQEDVGVLTHIDEYDFGLPGSGMLIWHIDENVVEQNLPTNSINNNRDHRGVDLVECDGAQDLGYYYSFFDAGYGTESGDYWDVYWSGNESHKVVNGSDEVALSPESIPNSDANNGAKTHIRIDQISARDSVMTFNVSSGMAQSGFPQYIGRGFAPGALTSCRIENGKETAVFAARKDGVIFGLYGDGSPLVAAPDTADFAFIRQPEDMEGLPVFSVALDSVLLPPAIADVNGDQLTDVVAVDKTGRLYVWSYVDKYRLGNNASKGKIIRFSSFDLDMHPTAGPLLIRDSNSNAYWIVIGLETGFCRAFILKNNTVETVDLLKPGYTSVAGLAAFAGSSDLIITLEDGRVCSCKMDGSVTWQASLPETSARLQPAVADFNNDGQPEIVVVSKSGSMHTIDRDGQVLGSYKGPGVNTGSPALGDVDDDGLPEILMSGSGRFHAYKFSGVPTLNFPAGESSDFSCENSPLWFESGEKIALIAGPDPLIRAYYSDGKKAAGFPLTAAGNVSVTPLLDDLDMDGDLELVVWSEDGYLYAWSLGLKNEAIWARFGANAFNDFNLTFQTSSHAADDLMPPRRVFCYPNPTTGNQTNIRYSLTQNVDQVQIRIFDLAGDFVKELAAPAVKPGDHEVVWDLNGIQSGVYIARIEAQTNSINRVEFIKIAVTK